MCIKCLVTNIDNIKTSSMEERSECVKQVRLEENLSNSRKSKKRGNKKCETRIGGWCDDEQREMNGGAVPNMDYTPIFWQQSGVAPHMQPPHNGQRLYTAISDPTVCGYSTVPVAYTMEPVSMPPVYPLYRPVPRPNYRSLRGRPRINMTRNPHMTSQVNQQSSIVNGYSSLQDSRSNYLTPSLYQNGGDYTSLPPSANNHIVNDAEELNPEHRRYSDPGLGPTDLPSYANSDDSDSEESGSSITTIGKNNKLVLTLVEQMTTLREANSQMFRELHETKLSLENMKAELSQVKQHTSLDYQPGMLSDIISEMREANKILDETIWTKVNAIIEEKNNQNLAELDEVKVRLAKMIEEKVKVDERITKLEEDVTGLKINHNNEDREIAAFEEETLTLRRELQVARAARSGADDNVAKCVDTKLASAISPMNFNTPFITSTPVRTDIHESCCASSTDFQASSSSTSSTSSPLPSLSLPNSSRNVKSIGAAEIDEDWHWNKCPTASSEPIVLNTKSSANSSQILEKLNDEESKELEENTNNEQRSMEIYKEQGESVQSIKSMEPDEQGALERLIHFHFNREQPRAVELDAQRQKNRKYYCKNDRTVDLKSLSHFSCVGAAATPVFSLNTDVIDQRTIVFEKDNGSLTSRMLTKNDVSEVPDVIVVAGKSVVPKHLCSTRILTSRVLTAPSRATYTTAYI